MRLATACSGIGAPEEAARALGWTPTWCAEVAPFPSRVLAARHPGSTNLGDLEALARGTTPIPAGGVDVLVAGTPCFPASTLIATKRGLLSIGDVVVGDCVLTHMGRWRRVLATGHRPSKTICLRGQGAQLATTAEHPIYSREKRREWVGRAAGSWRSSLSRDASWTPASEMRGRFWASPQAWPRERPPRVRLEGQEHPAPPPTPAMFWVIGRWLGDGWCRINGRRGYVIICSGRTERAEMEAALGRAGCRFSVSEERTTLRFQIANRALARWLVQHCGHGAERKTVPSWAFGLRRDFRRQLLAGYLSADGCVTKNGWRATTISKALALGTVLLAHSLGYSTSLRFVRPKRTHVVLEGRRLAERGFFQVSIYSRSRSSVAHGHHRWGLVREVTEGPDAEVFNLEVEDDNSYVADGIVVHNCQSFSVAGLRRGLADPRGSLALAFLGLAERVRPAWLVWENVPGILSADGGRAFGAFLGALGELGYGWAYRVLDAQHFGLAQRRERVFLVARPGGEWQRCAAVLLEPESMRGDPPPRREAGAEAARETGGGPPGGGIPEVAGTLGLQAHGYGLDLDTSGAFIPELGHAVTTREGSRQDPNGETLIAHALRAEGHDASEDGTGSRHNRANPKSGDPAPPLASTGRAIAFHHTQGVMVDAVIQCANRDRARHGIGIGIREGEAPMYTLDARSDHGLMVRGSAVRRLTPLECERLQGFPDGYTRIPVRKVSRARLSSPRAAGGDYEEIGGEVWRMASDAARYHALGNSMAVPVLRWIFRRLEVVHKELAP